VIAVRNAGGSLPSSLRIPEGGHNSETQWFWLLCIIVRTV
jgi:hypothetical protein